METICKTLSNRERKTYAKLKARLEHEQSAVLPPPQSAARSAPRRAHRVQYRHGRRDGEPVPDSNSLALGVEEAARLIGVSRATIYVLIARGDLRTIKIRKRRLVPREALVELLAVGAA
jgi:excisionase family DNA binding protein